ncbi:MAG: DGQHR domain-containing protein [Gammaproteobacteria bacterium]|nr:DGQHR domain-containing protein [Gammaproteobacteria bacterium]
MNIYPAIQGKMGRWQYYMVKMSMRELAGNVKFAEDIYDDRTLDEAIQRELVTSRVKREIVTYLVRQPDRFFSSIVVAALKGDPKWYPVTMEDDERFLIFRDDRRINDSFGVLRFDGTQEYYALDGQHRLAAIQALVDPSSDLLLDAPKGFKDDEISVIIVVPSSAESPDEFRMRYRRLFGNLNRYAKPTDQVTNIIMDEDDAFAILTRRLITEHQFFRFSGKQKESQRIKTTKGKNLTPKDPYFTSLETLYAMNIALLSSRERRNNGWDAGGIKNPKEFCRFRPDDQLLESLFEELKMYWDALIEVLPDLRKHPTAMRDHSAPSGDGSTQDSALFWPITQQLVAEVARDLIDDRPEPELPLSLGLASSALTGLGKLNWNLHKAPWRHSVIIPDAGRSAWKIRNEDRKEVMNVVKRVARWQLGVDQLSSDGVEELRGDWGQWLMPAIDKEREDEMWEEVEALLIR